MILSSSVILIIIINHQSLKYTTIGVLIIIVNFPTVK
jgi:hypothetical protein